MSPNVRDSLRCRGNWVATAGRHGRRLLAAVGFAFALAAPAGATIQVDCDTPDDFCTGNPCVTADKIEVTVASCVLDFGARDLVIVDNVDLEVNGSTLSLTAQSIQVQKRIDGKQNNGDGADITLIATAGDIGVAGALRADGGVTSGTIVLDAASNIQLSRVRSKGKKAASGGTVTIDAGDTVTAKSIIVRGRKNNTVGGQATITAQGGVNLFEIDARGVPAGTVSVTCPTCSITVQRRIRVDGWRRNAGGGTATLNAGGDITVNGKIVATARAPGGTISLTANGTVDADRLEAKGKGVAGGMVAVMAGTVSALRINTNGKPGGTIKLTSTVGDVTLRVAKSRGLGNATGGTIEIDSAANATIERRAEVHSKMAGGEVRVSAPGDVTLGTADSANFDASGSAGGVIEGAAGGDLTAIGEFEAAVGGCIGLSAGGTLNTTNATFDVPLAMSCP